ncbi:MAG: hypothetical protein RLZZ505_2717 [Verrucomicrobiota bacterium]|jgi:hypothetical protein
MKIKTILIITATAAFALGGQTYAAVVNVITPTGITISDSTGTYETPGGTGFLLDDSGLSTAIGSTIDTVSVLPTITVAGSVDSIGWRRNGSAAPAVDFTFSLGAAKSFNGIIIGNYWESEAGNLPYRGVSTFGLEISTDGGFTYTPVQTVNPAQSTGNLEYISLGTTYAGVTHIKFNDATYFNGDGAHIMGMNEVRFTIPEPSAALLGGLGMLVLLNRRRRF